MTDNYTSIEEREALKHWGSLTLADKQLKRVLKEHGVSYKTCGKWVRGQGGKPPYTLGIVGSPVRVRKRGSG